MQTTSPYSGLIKEAQSQYGAIQAGYNQQAANFQQNWGAINTGYNTLGNQVLGGIANIGAARSQDIARTYTSRLGGATQNLVNAGLGNTTVQSSLVRGFSADEQLEQTRNAESVAQTKAGYQTQIGMARLGYGGQASRDYAGLLGQKLGYMGQYQNHLMDLGGRFGLQDDAQEHDMAMARYRGNGGGGGTSGGGSKGGGKEGGGGSSGGGHRGGGGYGGGGSEPQWGDFGGRDYQAIYGSTVPYYNGGGGWDIGDPFGSTNYGGIGSDWANTPSGGGGGYTGDGGGWSDFNDE